jgi:hypothetical protein
MWLLVGYQLSARVYPIDLEVFADIGWDAEVGSTKCEVAIE